MLPLTNITAGTTMGFPNTCNTPTPAGPTPIPYPSVGQTSQANRSTCSQKVTVMNAPVCMKETEITMTNGDQAGTAGGGIVSGTFMGPAKFKLGSFTVSIEGKGAAYQNALVGSNGSNANCPIAVQVDPSQTVVTVAP